MNALKLILEQIHPLWIVAKFTFWGGSPSTPADTTNTQTAELPEWARGYAKDTLAKASALTNINQNPYQQYSGNRIAGFTDLQNQAQQGAANMGVAGQVGVGSNLAGAAGAGALGTNYQAGQFSNQFQSPGSYQPGQFSAQQTQAPNLQNYQMGPAERVRSGNFDNQSAEQYMSPYTQNVVDYQKSQALRDYQTAQPMRNAQAVKSGAFGGSRGAIVDAEAQRNLNSQLQGIEASGQQAAFQNAQQQFNADQARRMQAQQSNQQAGLTVGGQNLAALLGVQQLGAGQNLQSQLANQQAGLTAQQGTEQSRQFGAGQGLQAAGLNAQYGQAANQLGEQSRQYGAGLGMQGLQTALQSASTLGQLGQTQYGQQMGINQLQNQYGTQQQQQNQRPLDMAYQDFLNQQNYPYKQLGFMSDMVRGLPLGQQSTSQIYQAPPSTLQTVGALGLGAYGLSQLGRAKGGLAESYAGGGMVAFGDGGDTSVTDSPMDDPSAMAQAVSKLSDEQLQQIVQHPSSAAELQAAKTELATRASERNGLASAYNMMPQQASTTQATPQAPQQPMMQAAKGGIMGFADEGQVDLQKLINRNSEEAGYVSQDDLDEDEGGNGNEQVTNTGMSEINAVNRIGSKAMTPDEYLLALANTNKSLRDQAGKDSGYEQFSKELADAKQENAGAFEQQKGLAALAAIPAMLQGGNAIRGLGAGTGAFANLYGQYASADKKQKLALSEMQFKLADAKRKENLGLTKDAVAAMDAVRKSGAEADKFELEKINTKNKLLKTVSMANKPVKGPNPNYDINAQAAYVRNLKNKEKPLKGETPEQYEDRIQAMAFDIHTAAKNAKVSDITSRSNVTSNVTGAQEHEIKPGGAEEQIRSDANAIALADKRRQALKDVKNTSGYLAAQRRGDTAETKRLEDEAVADFPVIANPKVAPKAAPNNAAPAPVNMPPVSALKPGVVTTFKNGQKWTLNAQGQPVQVK